MPFSRQRGRVVTGILLFCLTLGATPAAVFAESRPPGFPAAPLSVSLERVVRGIPGPIAVTNAGDGTGRIFVNEQAGRVRVIADDVLLPTPFLDIQNLVSAEEAEEGLLGIAFHPNYADNGFFYVAFTARDATNTVMRFHVSAADPNVADPASGTVILAIPDRHPEHHNGGMLAFGPEGYLYISTGDEGFTYDEVGNSQSLASLHGKILRIDVDGGDPYRVPDDNPFVAVPGARGEIWAMGLRNPWRFTFDSATGDMYIGDVGQDQWEEINYLPAGERGANYGWNLMEGNHCFAPIAGDCAALPANLMPPIVEYSHEHGCAVIGGQVYHGSRSPLLAGRYLFSDVCSGTLWTLAGDAEHGWSIEELLRTELSVTAIGLDEDGEILLTAYQSGSVYRVVANDSLQRTWDRTDEPVAAGMVTRTWLWGAPVTPRVLEQYADASGGTRLVQYFDKSRMEVTDLRADAESLWYVTNGLLVQELITGRLQLGDDTFEQRAAAEVPVAGDPDSDNTPTYALLEPVLDAPAQPVGATLTQRMARDGTVTDDATLAGYAVTGAYHVSVPGISHTIATPFWDFMLAEGLVLADGAYRTDVLFPNPFYATGFPITEAYWVSTRVGGIGQDVLVQCFERRCLTYTPGNDPAWRVEAGNIGQHYHRWRYGE